jgi:hypothetical protein
MKKESPVGMAQLVEGYIKNQCWLLLATTFPQMPLKRVEADGCV